MSRRKKKFDFSVIDMKKVNKVFWKMWLEGLKAKLAEQKIKRVIEELFRCPKADNRFNVSSILWKGGIHDVERFLADKQKVYFRLSCEYEGLSEPEVKALKFVADKLSVGWYPYDPLFFNVLLEVVANRIVSK